MRAEEARGVLSSMSDRGELDLAVVRVMLDHYEEMISLK